MSNSLAIAAATATLRSLLIKGLGISDITVKPVDAARKGVAGDQVNLFLYQISISAAWRNQTMPHQTKAGETGQPPLPLCLYYLVTAFGEGDDETKAQQLLGKAMSIFHDHPILGTEEIRQATETDVAGSDLHEQIERVRIRPQTLSLEELSKLWSAFQTNYRLSSAYEVSVVLIESTRPNRTPLPVLTRGKDDMGIQTLLGKPPTLSEIRVSLSGTFVTSDVPSLDEVLLTKTLPSAQLGDELALIGQNLLGDSVRVVLERQLTGERLEPSVVRQSDQVIIIKLPPSGDTADPTAPTAMYPAGFYLATVIVQHSREAERHSNSLAVALAPTIALEPLEAAPGNISLMVATAPMIQPGQRVALLFRDSEIVAATALEPTDQLVFDLQNIPAGQLGEYIVRLRVDGVDSIPIDRGSAVPRFTDDQRLKVV